MIGGRCGHCGWGCVYPNKRDYITCLRCRQLTKYLNEKQYLKSISKQAYVPVKDDSILCACGCGQRSTVITANRTIRRYINTHHLLLFHNNCKGKHFSLEHRNNIRKSNIGKHPYFIGYWSGKHMSQDTINKMRESHTGKHFSLEHRMKMKESQCKGRPNPIDMSNRKCSICGNNKTVMLKTGRPYWRRLNKQIVCNRCYKLDWNNQRYRQ